MMRNWSRKGQSAGMATVTGPNSPEGPASTDTNSSVWNEIRTRSWGRKPSPLTVTEVPGGPELGEIRMRAGVAGTGGGAIETVAVGLVVEVVVVVVLLPVE